MSEKEQRELLDRFREVAHDIYSIEAVGDLQALYDDAAEALAKDPDAVRVALELKAMHDNCVSARDRAVLLAAADRICHRFCFNLSWNMI